MPLLSPIFTSPDGETLIRFVFGTIIYFRPATIAIDCGGVTSMSSCDRLLAKLAVGGTHDVMPPITLLPVDFPPIVPLPVVDSLFSFRLADIEVVVVADCRADFIGLSESGAKSGTGGPLMFIVAGVVLLVTVCNCDDVDGGGSG